MNFLLEDTPQSEDIELDIKGMLRCLSSFIPAIRHTRKYSARRMSHAIVAVTQMTATADKEENLKVCSDLVARAASMNAKKNYPGSGFNTFPQTVSVQSILKSSFQMVFLPEGCDYIAPDKESVVAMAEPLDGPLMAEYKNLATKNDIWISIGGFHQKVASPHDKVMKIKNTHILLSPDGNIAGMYNKIHMFDVNLPEKNVFLRESESCEAGVEIVEPVETPVGKIGLGLCYDLRFPDFAQALVGLGSEVLTYPSAFTVPTGMAHWEALLRARAIENQCYVVAAAQTGQHNAKRASYGHAMIVDPWGTVIAQCSEGTGLAVAEINREYIKTIRRNMPVQEHKRPDIYMSRFSGEVSPPSDSEEFQFGQVMIKGEVIFLRSQYSMAFVNLRCVVPGHVLVSPLRPALRIENMNPAEVADLFIVVQKVQKVMENVHGTTSSTVCVQDGVDAGQSIRHVHVHVLPRKFGDFTKNDDIYGALQIHDKNEHQAARTREEMVAECRMLRRHFNK